MANSKFFGWFRLLAANDHLLNSNAHILLPNRLGFEEYFECDLFVFGNCIDFGHVRLFGWEKRINHCLSGSTARHGVKKWVRIILRDSLCKQIKIMFDSGIEKSSLSMELYCKEENRHDKLMKILIVYSTFVIITVYVPPLLLPIGYATLGFPSPKNWYLPYPTALVSLSY